MMCRSLKLYLLWASAKRRLVVLERKRMQLSQRARRNDTLLQLMLELLMNQAAHSTEQPHDPLKLMSATSVESI